MQQVYSPREVVDSFVDLQSMAAKLGSPAWTSSLLNSTSRLQCAFVATRRLLRGVMNCSLTFTSALHKPVCVM